MNLITDPLRQLIRRKLWPVALLLVGGLVAVPVLLAKQPEPTVAPSTFKTETTEGVPSTFVSVAEEGEVTARRRVLGVTKDPFEPKALPKKKKAKTAEADATATPEATTAEPTTPTPPTSTPPVSATPTAEPTPDVPANSVKVRFGPSDADELETQTLERMTALPSEDEPVFVFMGLEDNGKTAVFMLAGEVTPQGDGECLPTPEDCQTLKLRVGETEFFDVVVPDAEEPVQYQLDVVKLNKS